MFVDPDLKDVDLRFECLKPVSYTHLDVYKRQTYEFEFHIRCTYFIVHCLKKIFAFQFFQDTRDHHGLVWLYILTLLNLVRNSIIYTVRVFFMTVLCVFSHHSETESVSYTHLDVYKRQGQ